MLKQRAPSWWPSKSASNMSPSRWRTRSSMPAPETISRPIRALPGRSTTVAFSPGCRRQSAIENSPWAPATSSREWASRWQRHRLRHLGAGEAGELVLAADVGAPVGIVGGFVVQLDVAALADEVLEAPATSPSSRRCRRGSRRGSARRRGRASGGPARSSRSGRRRAAPGGRARRQRRAPARSLPACSPRCSASSAGSRGPSASAVEHPGSLRDLQAARDRHPEHRLADRGRQPVRRAGRSARSGHRGRP